MSRGFVTRFSFASLVAAAVLTANASSAGAAVTIGQLAPGNSPPALCSNDVETDYLQPTVTSGNSFVVPNSIATGTITSWSHNAAAGPGQQLTIKVYRKLVDPNLYQVVSHDGPRSLAPSAVNTFSAGIPVKAGDVLGLNDNEYGTVHTACAFGVLPEERNLIKNGNLADGEAAFFGNETGQRLNITAAVEPDCDNDGLGDETQDPDISSCAPPPPGTTPPPIGIPPPGSPPGTPPVTCRGLAATIVGTEGNDVRVGSPARDVIAGLGGNDALSGIAGNDVICGGAGEDTLRGGKGKDTLLGQKGKDKLRGGGAKDLCKGGKGKDTASKCEVEKSI